MSALYVVVIGFFALLGLPHLLVVWIKGILALRANRPYRYGLFDGGIFGAGKLTSPKKVMGWTLAGWMLVIGFGVFASYSRYSGWMNGSCQSILAEKTIRANAKKGVSLGYSETAFSCSIESRGYFEGVSFKAAASKDTVDEHARAVADGDAEESSGAPKRPRSSWLADPEGSRPAKRRAQPETLAPWTRLVELERTWVVVHAHQGVHGELRLAKTSFDRAGAIALAAELRKNEAAMERYATGGRPESSGAKAEETDGVKAWDDAHKASATAAAEPTSPLVGVFGVLMLLATGGVIAFIVRRTIVARRRAFEALHSTRNPPVSPAAT